MTEQQKTVHATILNIGELEQITPKFSKADFEYQVAGNDDVHIADVPHWHRGALVEGNTYELVLKARQRDDGTHYTPMISEKPERVGQMIQLLIAGKLITDSDEPIKNVRKVTLESWYSEQIDLYWNELEMREPNDVFGNLKDGS